MRVRLLVEPSEVYEHNNAVSPESTEKLRHRAKLFFERSRVNSFFFFFLRAANFAFYMGYELDCKALQFIVGYEKRSLRFGSSILERGVMVE